jgi:hypothetical protein
MYAAVVIPHVSYIPPGVLLTTRLQISNLLSSVCKTSQRCTILHENAPKTVHISQKMAAMKWVRFCAIWPELLIEKFESLLAHWPAKLVPKYKADPLD